MITNEAAARHWLGSLPEWDAAAAERIDRLISLLSAENRQQNLVSRNSLQAVWQRHIADSAQLLRFVMPSISSPWLDLGTGAGFPGLVIAALRPACQVIMVEARARRSAWLEQACDALGLTQARVVASRLELLSSQPVCVISARAFAPLPRLLDLSARFSTAETIWLLPKGQSAQHELAELDRGRHLFHVEQSLTDPDAGIIVGTIAGSKGKQP